MSKPADDLENDGLLSDQEVRERLMANPEIRARAEQIASEVRKGKPRGSGITAGELSDFLREHGMDPRQGERSLAPWSVGILRPTRPMSATE